MQITFKQAFSLLDGRLSTKFEDVIEILSFIFDKEIYTHEVPTYMDKLEKINPRWFAEGIEKLEYLKKSNNTNDFKDLMEIIDTFHNDRKIEIKKISPEEIKFHETN